MTVTTDPEARWTFTGRYATVRITPWGVNESGQTYGTANANGTPDLIAVLATNRRSGYAFARELFEPLPANPAEAAVWQTTPQITVSVPVYESDGKTRIGEFRTPRSAAAHAAVGKRPPAVPQMPSPVLAGR